MATHIAFDALHEGEFSEPVRVAPTTDPLLFRGPYLDGFGTGAALGSSAPTRLSLGPIREEFPDLYWQSARDLDGTLTLWASQGGPSFDVLTMTMSGDFPKRLHRGASDKDVAEWYDTVDATDVRGFVFQIDGPYAIGSLPMTVRFEGDLPKAVAVKGLSMADLLADDMTIRANATDDCVEAGPSDDALYGRVGHDSLDGGSGDDVLNGGAGNDVVRGGAGADRLVETLDDGLSGFDTMIHCFGVGAEGPYNMLEWFDGPDGADRVFGGPGHDTLLSGSGDDTLNGGAGADRLLASGGSDTLIGGDGAERFVFEIGNGAADAARAAPSSRHVIRDFESGEGDLLKFRTLGGQATEITGRYDDVRDRFVVSSGTQKIVLRGIDDDAAATMLETDWGG